MKTAALVVTYNRADLLEESLKALMAIDDLDIYVFDNASTDRTPDLLRSLKNPKLHVIRSTENLGGAGGFSKGMKAAMASNADAIWLMDDDTIASKESLAALEKAVAADPDYGFVSSKALWVDGSENRMNHHRLLKGSKTPYPLCREATFVSLLVNTDAIVQAGLPIAEYFIWGDDIEYTRRLSGLRNCYYAEDSAVLHKTANNAGSDLSKDDAGRIARYYYAYRNEVCSAKRESFLRMLRQGAKILYHTGKVLAKAPDHKAERVKMIWKASLDGLKFSPAIESVSYETNTRAGGLPGTH